MKTCTLNLWPCAVPHPKENTCDKSPWSWTHCLSASRIASRCSQLSKLNPASIQASFMQSKGAMSKAHFKSNVTRKVEMPKYFRACASTTTAKTRRTAPETPPSWHGPAKNLQLPSFPLNPKSINYMCHVDHKLVRQGEDTWLSAPLTALPCADVQTAAGIRERRSIPHVGPNLPNPKLLWACVNCGM